MLFLNAFVCVTEIVHVRLYVCLIVFACVEFFVCVLWYRCALLCLCLAARFSFEVLSLFLFSSHACVRAVWLLSVCCVLFVGAGVCVVVSPARMCVRVVGAWLFVRAICLCSRRLNLCGLVQSLLVFVYICVRLLANRFAFLSACCMCHVRLFVGGIYCVRVCARGGVRMCLCVLSSFL